MILLDRITKTYPGDEEPALDNVSLHIEPHEFVFLVGKSGAGKSTLIKMITKEENPDSGKIIVGGIDLDFVRRRHIPHYRRRLGVVFQDYKLLPTRTVFENVSFALEIAGMSNREIIKTVPKVLDLVGLSDKANKFPTHLSGGERQRVSIARSVARQPKILIADEPTGNLDKLTRQEIIELLQKINDFGTTLLVTTHDENIVNNLSKRVVTLKAGRIVDDQKYHGIYRLDSEDDQPFKKAVSPDKQDPEELQAPIIIHQQPLRTTSRSSTKHTAAADQRLTSSLQFTMRLERDADGNVRAVRKEPLAKSSTKTTPKTSTKQSSRNSTKPNPKPDLKSSPKSTSKPAPKIIKKTAKPLERDSANQWYTASKPLRSAPKLSNLSPGQTVKLKPAPTLKSSIKPIPRPRAKRVI